MNLLLAVHYFSLITQNEVFSTPKICFHRYGRTCEQKTYYIHIVVLWAIWLHESNMEHKKVVQNMWRWHVYQANIAQKHFTLTYTMFSNEICNHGEGSNEQSWPPNTQQDGCTIDEVMSSKWAKYGLRWGPEHEPYPEKDNKPQARHKNGIHRNKEHVTLQLTKKLPWRANRQCTSSLQKEKWELVSNCQLILVQ